MMPTGVEHIDIPEAIKTAEGRRGTKAPYMWEPYKLWVGDLWRCPECSHEIVVGVSNRPLSERFHPDFNSLVERYGGDQLKVNDC
jgi:hypothetical protein